MEDIIGNYGGRFLLAIFIVGGALAAFVFAVRFLRNRGAASFLTGTRPRHSRLQVLDTTAVDARRRLVLVRRDDVEHLIMIGGPTDVVIESRIVSEPETVHSDEARFYQDAYASPAYSASYADEGYDDEEDAEGFAAPPPAPSPLQRPATGPAADWRRQAERAWSSGRSTPAAAAPPAPAAPAPLSALEAARKKLFAQRRGTDDATPPSAKTETVKEQMNDFEKMLKAEMASRQQSERASPPAGASAPRTGQRSASSNDQPDMQQQIARIFGEDH